MLLVIPSSAWRSRELVTCFCSFAALCAPSSKKTLRNLKDVEGPRVDEGKLSEFQTISKRPKNILSKRRELQLMSNNKRGVFNNYTER